MIQFGTDGWRGRIARDFTFENVRKVSQAISDFLSRKGPKGTLIIGHDRRFLSEKFARSAAEVLAGNGFRVLLFSKPVPTPLVSFTVVQKNAVGGVVLTASHNPPEFHGLKFKESRGSSATPQTTEKIESHLGRSKIRRFSFEEALRKKKIGWIDSDASYLSSLRKATDLSLFKKFRINVLADALHGSSADYIHQALSLGSVKVEILHAERDVLFGGVSPEPIPQNLGELTLRMRKGPYDIGIALDGDGDRLAAMMPGGIFLTPTHILTLILYHFVNQKKLQGKVVKTISVSSLIDRIADSYDLPLEETPIGFKHISERMSDPDFLIGGEESGGMGFRGSPFPERDGILSALFLLEAMAASERPIHHLLQKIQREFGPLETGRVDLHYPKEKWTALLRRLRREEKKLLLEEVPLTVKDFDGLKLIGKNRWILFRMSGTEPLLRIYAEGRSQKEVNQMLQRGRALSQKELSR